MRSALLPVALAACSFSGPVAGGGADGAVTGGDSSSGDAGIDGAAALGPWGTPVRVTALEFMEAGDNYDDPSITTSGMLYYAATGGVSVDGDIYRAQRRANGSFTEPQLVPNLNDLNAGQRESNIWVERDHSRIIFGRNGDLFESTRDAGLDTWSAPAPIDELNTGQAEGLGQLTDGGLTLYFIAVRDGDPSLDIYRVSRPALDQPFDLNTLVKLPVSSDSTDELSPKLSDDGLTLYWSQKATNELGGAYEIMSSERASTGDEFLAGAPVVELGFPNAIDSDFSPGPDHRSAFFSSDRENTAEGERIFFVERLE